VLSRARERRLRSEERHHAKVSAILLGNLNARGSKYSLGANALEHTGESAGQDGTATRRVGSKFGRHDSDDDSDSDSDVKSK